MDPIKHGIILLIQSAITGEQLTLPEEFDISKAVPHLKKHGLIPLGYAGAVNCGIDPDTPLMEKLQEQYLLEYYTSDCQLRRLQQVFDAFEENGIEYMPLKGTIMKHLYPSHEMRSMSDGDVLIHPEQRDKLQSIMEQLGFKPLSESDHEWNWTTPEIKLELHKRLVSSDDKDYYRYFGEGWQFAKTRDGCRWSMTKEDAFIFEFAHFARHYCTHGVSVRHIIDLWIHIRCNPSMDTAYVRTQLATMDMAAFYDNIMVLVDAWFCDGPWDEKTEFISDYIFSGGVSKALSDRARAAQKTGSIESGNNLVLLRRIFPFKKHISWNYPQLKNLPLPLAWAARWALLLTVRKDHIATRREEMESVSSESVENHLKGLEYAGIRFSE